MRVGECCWEAAVGYRPASGGRRVGQHGGLVVSDVDGLLDEKL